MISARRQISHHGAPVLEPVEERALRWMRGYSRILTQRLAICARRWHRRPEMESPVMTPAPLLTTDDYLRTPETLRPTELVYGAIRVADAPTVRHQQAVGAFYLHLVQHVRLRGLGTVLLSPLDVVLDYSRAVVLQPDLLFVSQARLPIVGERVVGAPDMILEVLSPNPRVGSLQQRIDLFAAYGVREIWLLHQNARRFELLGTEGRRAVSQYSIDYHTSLTSAVLPDFRMRIEDVLHD
jgi:Uma2 family endonuclease